MSNGGKFLGNGWSFPPAFSRASGSVNMVSDDANIQQSLWVIFSTAFGERVMLPQFGSQLSQMVFRSLNTNLITEMQTLVEQAIVMWEPRIDVAAIQIEESTSTDGLVLISVDYVVRKTNSRSNLVYPFYLNEATIPQVQP